MNSFDFDNYIFPPEADIRFSILNNYIEDLSEFINVTYEQKLQRLRAQINKTDDPVSKSEFEGELLNLEENGSDLLSHIVWGGVLVSIFGTFEFSLRMIMEFINTDLGKEKFQQKKRMNFIKSAHNYFKNTINTPLFVNKEQYVLIQDLSEIRNSYVHNGCAVNLLKTRLRKIIEEGKYGRYKLEISNGNWYANQLNAKLYYKYTHDCFKSFEHRVFEAIN